MSEAKEESIPEFTDAVAFQKYVLSELSALRVRVEELDSRHTLLEEGTEEISAKLSLLHGNFDRFLEKTAPWLENVQHQLDRIERKFDSLMTRIDELLDDIMELRARRRDAEPDEWTN